MPLARASVLFASFWLAVCGAWLPVSTAGSAQLVANGRVLAVIGRQVGFLNFDAPRPRILTALAAPSFAMDVSAVPGSSLAVM